ncbi:hypothetical protein ILYODFUR_016214 [Ilyodon furcidens]|uniref:Uncharacterized protein n=1 Tax=Ilyodon furcidens TaxID=33524 RepID=A0ABV0UUA8_9TELE
MEDSGTRVGVRDEWRRSVLAVPDEEERGEHNDRRSHSVDSNVDLSSGRGVSQDLLHSVSCCETVGEK